MPTVVNRSLAEKLENAEIDCLISRLAGIKEIKGNPMGVEFQKFESATAFTVKNIPGPAFNTVKGLKKGNEREVERIINFYRKKKIPARFELSPSGTSPDLFANLSKKGFYHHDFHTVLFRSLSSNIQIIKTSISPGITIRELKRHEFGLFADIYTNGFQMPSFLKQSVAENNEVLYDNKDWTFYLAIIENEPAGIGVLFMKNGIATLAAAATLPEFRNRGVQSALISHRINQAYIHGCYLITGQAKFGSVSQNNMEREGLKVAVAYTKSIWIKRDDVA
ncbi:GNAT family N-acetyltransferase [Heyndrickxia acidicola]|uniref:GNAT family N-acetyltransferase n=1 Tax=Heyndrickxia acidicola TaxID=209389 RepID=A0ABU6MM76_9BACI|nr:GNAT family N-acetyltransferase [Heyndrickxia acidicola]MED1205789.1 GNAT family N-acetyltransferase [Heyndrickxia acidicola]